MTDFCCFFCPGGRNFKQKFCGRGWTVICMQAGLAVLMIAVLVVYYLRAKGSIGRTLNDDDLIEVEDVDDEQASAKKIAVKISANSVDKGSSGPYKTVLLWSTWFGDASWKNIYDVMPLAPWVESFNKKRCFVTTNRSNFASADAVIFHGRDINFQDLPDPTKRKLNNSSQKFVFYLLEAPANSGLSARWAQVSSIGFHWVMSFSTKADVFYPYGRLLPNGNDKAFKKESVAKKIDEFVESFPKRKTDAVWIVSNCNANSKRQTLVARMQQSGISVDIKGACSKEKPDKEWNEPGGVERFFKRYRFYLSFENTLCDDYASEKLYLGFNASQHFGLIPIVYGGANYSAILPAGTYIDVQKFEDIKGLARYLKNLTKADDENAKAKLRKFYDWQYNFHISNRRAYRHENGWSTLCQRLWEVKPDDHANSKKSPFIKDISTRLGSCRSGPPQHLLV